MKLHEMVKISTAQSHSDTLGEQLAEKAQEPTRLYRSRPAMVRSQNCTVDKIQAESTGRDIDKAGSSIVGERKRPLSIRASELETPNYT
jgi:hypothetical protein